MSLLLPTLAVAEEPLPETENSSIGYESVAEALAVLKAKPGTRVTEQPDGWTVIVDDRAIWSFTPEGHPAYPSAVRREAVERDGRVMVQMSVLCQAAKAPCDQLVRDFQQLNEQIGKQARNESPPAAASNPRDPEVTAFATHWLDLVEHGEADKSFAFLTDIFKSSMTSEQWRAVVAETNASLGVLRSRKLRRVVWYDNPANAPMPGTYIAVEFDSVYEKAPKHFSFVILHAQGEEALRVMRHESFVGDASGGGR